MEGDILANQKEACTADACVFGVDEIQGSNDAEACRKFQLFVGQQVGHWTICFFDLTQGIKQSLVLLD